MHLFSHLNMESSLFSIRDLSSSNEDLDVNTTLKSAVLEHLGPQGNKEKGKNFNDAVKALSNNKNIVCTSEEYSILSGKLLMRMYSNLTRGKCHNVLFLKRSKSIIRILCR